jgi:transcriptional regulator with XRE-family HTH domain
MTTLKDRLSRLRERFDLTQEQVAELTGISQRQISRYESGGDITGDNLLKLSQAFGVSNVVFIDTRPFLDNPPLLDICL